MQFPTVKNVIVPAFLNRIIFGYLIPLRYHSTAKSLIFIGMKKINKWINIIYNVRDRSLFIPGVGTEEIRVG
jgi:hypothetical protein